MFYFSFYFRLRFCFLKTRETLLNNERRKRYVRILFKINLWRKLFSRRLR